MIWTWVNARRGAYVSEDTANKIATAFSFYHIGGSVGKITLEDLLMEPDNFQKRFPKDEFKTIKEKEKVTKLPLFTNKVYRGYYMLPNSSYNQSDVADIFHLHGNIAVAVRQKKTLAITVIALPHIFQ